jgi:hypothetical protein
VKDIHPGLEVVLQRALAKEPDDRYATASDFARAFTSALSSSGTSTLHLPDAPPTNIAPPAVPAVLPPTQTTVYAETPRRGSPTTLVTVLLAVAAFALALIAFVLVSQRDAAQPLTASTSVPTAAALAPTAVPRADAVGSARYSTTRELGDTLTLTADNLAPLPAGGRYVVWLFNTNDETLLRLGALTVDVQGSGTLIYTDEEGRLLPALFNEISLSVETDDSDTPKGDIIYRASIPPALSSALRAILLESPDGINGGSLLAGAVAEGSIGRQHAGLAANARNLSGLRLHAEHTINILLGTREDLDGSGRGENPGRGIGMAFFLDAIEAQITRAVDEAGDDPSVQTQVEYIRVCVVNARGWMQEVIALERALLSAADIAAVEAERARSTVAANAMLMGEDLNANGTIELFEGECALQQIGESGILAGNLTLRAVGGR